MPTTEPVLTAIFTIGGGLVTFVIGQVFVKAALEPMQELRREIGKIAYSLDFYANQLGKYAREPKEVNQIFRAHACRLRELSGITAFYTEWTVFGVLPRKDELYNASSLLIVFANSVGKSEPEGWRLKHDITQLLRIETEKSLQKCSDNRAV
jgi:hypothetical protein